MSAELQRACAEELIAELRKLEHGADRKNPGCLLAVCLGQAHRMIEELLAQVQASRAPGPATAHEKLIEILNDKIEQLVGEIRELKKAGTPCWRERDTMNGLVLANAELRRTLAEHEGQGVPR